MHLSGIMAGTVRSFGNMESLPEGEIRAFLLAPANHADERMRGMATDKNRGELTEIAEYFEEVYMVTLHDKLNFLNPLKGSNHSRRSTARCFNERTKTLCENQINFGQSSQ